MIEATSIDFFKNLAQSEYNNKYYDFHNDFHCEKIVYLDGTLSIVLKSLISEDFLSLKFLEVQPTVIDFFNLKEVQGLTLDNLYRGRIEINGDLIEVSEEGKGYFYLEFYEGQKMEFWAKSINLE